MKGWEKNFVVLEERGEEKKKKGFYWKIGWKIWKFPFLWRAAKSGDTASIC